MIKDIESCLRFVVDVRGILRDNELLIEDNGVLRKRLQEMHRRAQSNEGAIVRLERYKEEHRDCVRNEGRRVRKSDARKLLSYHRQYKMFIERIKESGISDVYVSRPDGSPFSYVGDLGIMINRLIDKNKELEKSNSLFANGEGHNKDGI